MKSLDAGAWAVVIVPLVYSAADAERAVAACRYPPRGLRSYGPIGASGVVGSGGTEVLEAEVPCLVVVETCEALERVDEIAGTPGLDGIYTSPCGSGALPRSTFHPRGTGNRARRGRRAREGNLRQERHNRRHTFPV